MNKKLKIIACILLVVIIAVAGYLVWYANDYYHAESSANALLNGTDNVTVNKIDNGLFLDGPGNESALIFYPGAKIEYTSYLPMFMDLANDGVDCFLVEMPFNLAVLAPDSADSIIDNGNYTYDKWYISGHSLGGSMAASYIKNHPDKIDGLILLAAYSADDLGDTPVLSIYGSNDGNLNKVTYEESLGLIDGNLTEYVIDGGNHAQFASYGIDKKDGKASISPEEQKNQTEEQILEFID